MSTIRQHVRSNVVGYIALFFALGLGSAWAATELERNEVTSKHIKNNGVKTKDLANNAVVSQKVADGTLLDADFAPGQLPQGEQGETGPSGTKGDTGLQGERGPSDTYYGFNAGGAAPSSAFVTVQVDVPAGDYAVTAVARGENPQETAVLLGRCTLFETPSDGIANHGYVAESYLPDTFGATTNPDGQAMLPATTVVRLTAPGTIKYSCQASSIGGAVIDASWHDLAITATQVAAVHG